MSYPCNRCGRKVTPQPSMCCGPCIKEIDKEVDEYVREVMHEGRQIHERWQAEDKAARRRNDPSSGGGCAVVVLAAVAFPAFVLLTWTLLSG
jgi:hypothetical protein